MSEPDWKTAPEGTTHYSKDTVVKWLKKEGDIWYDFSPALNAWDESNAHEGFYDALIKRPWHETGDLPPIGAECEFFIPNHISKSASLQCESGSRVDILFHFTAQGRNVAAYKFLFDGEVRIDYAISDCFRPIKSDRDKAIEEMIAIVSSGRAWQMSHEEAGILYDAGFRKPDEELNAELTALRLSLENSEKWKNELVEVVNDLMSHTYCTFLNQRYDEKIITSRNRAQKLLDSMEQK